MNSPTLFSREQSAAPASQELGQVGRKIESEPLAAGVSPSLRTPALQSFEELGIPDAYRATVENELTNGEKMLWLGRPSRNRLVHPGNAGLSIMGAGLVLFGLGIAVVSAGAGLHDFFPFVFAGVLAFIGLLCFLPRLIDPAKNCRSCYVVTNRRAMLVENSVWARGPAAKSYLPHQLVGMERRIHPSVAGAGDLIFEYIFTAPGNTFDMKSGFTLPQGAGFGRTDAPKRVPVGFFLLDEVREVENLIRTTLLKQMETALGEPVHSPSAAIAPEHRAEAVHADGNAIGAGATAGLPHGLEDGSVAADLKEKALADLNPNETVAWIGRPAVALVFARGAGWLVGGSVGVLIALIWLVGDFMPAKAAVPHANALLLQKALATHQIGKAIVAPKKATAPNLWLPAGLLAFAACCVSVPFVRRHFAGRTCYALTNRRAVVYKEGLFGPTRESYNPLEVAGMRRRDSWLFRGSGDLIFRSVTVVRGAPGGRGQSVKTKHYGFLAVAQIQGVERLVRETLIDRFVDKLTRASS